MIVTRKTADGTYKTYHFVPTEKLIAMIEQSQAMSPVMKEVAKQAIASIQP